MDFFTSFYSPIHLITPQLINRYSRSLFYSIVFVSFFNSYLNWQIVHQVNSLKYNDPHRRVPDHSLNLIFNLSNPEPVLNFHNPDSLLSKILIPRPVESQNLEKCRLLFSHHFKSLSKKIVVPIKSKLFYNAVEPPSYSSEPLTEISTWKLETHSFTDQTPYGIQSFKNQIFTHDPTASRRIVLAAHMDSKFFPNPPDNEFVGATDSAAPVAIILEVAKALTPLLDKQLERDIHLAESGMTIERTTLQVVLFDGEEAFQEWSDTDSIYGARALAKKWSEPLRTPTATTQKVRSIDQIQMLILFDLIGSQEPKIHNFFKNTSWFFNDLVKIEQSLLKQKLFLQFNHFNFTHLSNNHQILKKFDNSNSRDPFFVQDSTGGISPWGSVSDDHLPFLKEGVPILHLISVPFPKVWHTIHDNKEALDLQTILEWNLISQVALIQYLDLEKFLDGFALGSRDEL